MNKRILITGEQGFIGSRLFRELKRLGNSVYGFDLENGYDTRRREDMDKVFESFKPDLVIHLAALTGVKGGEANPHGYVTTNIVGTKNIVDACHKYNVEDIIFFSSSSVLGDTKDAKDEKAAYNPISIYGSSKVAGEAIMKNSGLNYVIVRPFTVYGPQGRGDMVVYKWINAIMAGEGITVFGDGDTSRGYTHVRDIISGVVAIIGSFDKCTSQIINIGGAEEVMMRDMVNIFVETFGKAGYDVGVKYKDIPDYDIKRSLAVIEKAKQLTGWEPKYKFKESLERIILDECS